MKNLSEKGKIIYLAHEKQPVTDVSEWGGDIYAKNT